MGMDAENLQVEPANDFLGLGQQFVPDAKTGGRSSNIGLVAAAGSQSGIDAQSHAVSGQSLPQRPQLLEGTGVYTDSSPDQVHKIFGELLRAQTDVLRRDTRTHGPTHFKTAAGVQFQPHLMKYLQYGRIRARFHGIASGKPERPGKIQYLPGALLKAGLIVDIDRGAESFSDVLTLRWG